MAAAPSLVTGEPSQGKLESAALVSQANSEVLQHLGRLSKKDATTRFKALQVTDAERC